MNIFTDADKMYESSIEFALAVNDLQDMYSKLNQLIEYLEPTWKGEASVAYLSKLKGQLNEIKCIIYAVEAMQRTAEERARTAISLDRLESLNIFNIGAIVGDIFTSSIAAIGSFF